MPTTHTPAADLYAVRRGTGPDVLLIAGLGDSWEAWSHQVDGLSHAHRITAFDNRGTGRSPLGDDPLSIPSMADDAAALLRALDVERAHVAGFSSGGAIAQELALRHPDLVRSLALSGTFARFDAYGQAMIRSWRWMMESAPSERDLLEGWLTWVYSRQAYASGWVDDVIQAMLDDPHAATLEAMQRTIDALLRHDTVDRLPEIEVPTLVLVGEHDPQVRVADARALADLIPGAELQVVPDQAHQPFQEEPEDYNRRLAAFWARVEAAG